MTRTKQNRLPDLTRFQLLINGEVIDHIADIAAGDARLGISILRRGAKHCVDNGLEFISKDVVDVVSAAAREAIATRYVESLSTHQRILYEIIAREREVDAGDLHAEYSREANDPRASSTRRGYLRSMEREGLIESVGEGRNRGYRIVFQSG